ncbi:MAG TPA: type II secretion system major pseudopilin GspG [bacterium]|nr:type II secretion system major pseudopilin GspG [bacterium]
MRNEQFKARRDMIRAAARDNRGFTLLEIMVVVIIIGTIAGLVGVKVLDRLEEAKMRTTCIQISTLRDALDLFKLDNGFYPTTEQGLEALVAPPEVGRNVNSFKPGGYLRDDMVPADPWGTPYYYMSDDGYFYQIGSVGPDGKIGTADDLSAEICASAR